MSGPAAWPVVAIAVLTAGAPPADTLPDLGRALTACFRPPPGSTGSQITVLLSLKRDGTVLGKPRITFTQLAGSEAEQRAFVAAALGSLAACTPVSLTPALGGAIAGRPFSIRFQGAAPGPSI